MWMDSVGGNDPMNDSKPLSISKKGFISAAAVQKPDVLSRIEEAPHGTEDRLAVFFRRDPAAKENQRAGSWQVQASSERGLGLLRRHEDCGIHARNGVHMDRISISVR